MKASPNARKAWTDGYAKGRSDQKNEDQRTITGLKDALDKALMELVAIKNGKPL